MKITAEIVKELREKTGAGMMDCKKALIQTDGDFEKAIDYLRAQGIAKAEKKASRAVNEGLIYAYIHYSNKLGAMVEVNCETDFVANTKEFQEFVKNVAMQIAASAPLAVSRDEIDPKIIEREKAIYKEQVLREGKPENIADKIVNGKLEKFYKENVLLEQPFFKDPERTIEIYLKETIGKLGENIQIARFARFALGENK
ncbi:MAG: translation elongation factor Ts [Candidatus Marinimicrobia bacterium]|nr:translation elongation factor Ts [Candidatus Neomarinimicrobiota bacterium]MDD5581807.1 translation elongation factor Ts [Candidatus Neomarinimicrobiota bacterium]